LATAASRHFPPRDGEHGQERGARDERDRVEREHPCRLRRRDQQAGGGGAEDRDAAPRELEQRVRLLEAVTAHGLGHESRRRRSEERLRGAGDERRRDEHPHLHHVRQQRNRRRSLDRRTDEIAREHDEAARQAVRPDAADENEAGAADGEGGEHQPEGAGTAADLEDRERQRDRDQGVAERRGRLAEPEQPERTFAQRPETRARIHPF
jgi:hypothetical protein